MGESVGMNVKERIEDISSRCGMSEDIIRRVLDAERESIVESLKKGERATLIGRCTLVPELVQGLNVNGITLEIRIKANPSRALSNEFEGMNGFTQEQDEEEQYERIKIKQLPGLI
jgi:hypothetical protein